MKKYLICFLLLSWVCRLSVNGQEKKDTVKPWAIGGITNFSFSQVSLSNWVAGGENSSSINALIKLFSTYKKSKLAWDNNLDLAYGLTKKASDPFYKNDDRIDFASKLGYKAEKKWYYTLMINFKTQFYQGKKSSKDSIIISDFMAPAYLLASLGMDYKPGKAFSLMISPFSSRITFVRNTMLADEGAFGVEKAVRDTSGNIIQHGEKIKSEFGGYLKVVINKEIVKNVTLLTKLELFSNYLKNPQNMVINWDMLLNMKINKFLSASINTNLIYDDNVRIASTNSKGQVEQVGPRTQFKEMISIGLSYKF